eukprot:TRINITY_DN14779_c0_g1_i1.p1 TRINITY_DN14779_c0_g1~~TRINITY_DN14779_c0_g1_i1.p1  ORF type:complete len:208 (-),score=42.20 TRINITY_DN14779_c0_g1_i1:2-535(-)
MYGTAPPAAGSTAAWACPICDRHGATSAACAAALEEAVGGSPPLPGAACPAVGAENADGRVPGCGDRVGAAAVAAVPVGLVAAVVDSARGHLFGDRPLSPTLSWWWAVAVAQWGVWVLCFFARPAGGGGLVGAARLYKGCTLTGRSGVVVGDGVGNPLNRSENHIRKKTETAKAHRG